ELDRMGRLVDALLTLERGDAEISMAVATNVAEVVRDRAEAWQELVEAHRVALVVETSDDAWALALPGAVEQVLDNLLDNALEVSPPDGVVTVRVVRAPSKVELHVVDEGPGLDAEARQYAFDRFWRGSRSSTGSGLGLAIVRRLAEASGGSARLDVAATGGVDAVVVLAPSSRSSGVAAGTESFALS